MKNNFGINDKSFEEMISLFKSFDNLDVVYIFGSRARGDYKTASDIDEKLLENIKKDGILIYKK